MTATYEVGQRVWIYDVNRRSGGPKEGVVTKVGRTLVTVEYADSPYPRPDIYRMDTGHLNDGYGHRYIRTDEERDRADRERAAWETLKANGLERRYATKAPSLEALEAIAALLDGEAS